MDLSIKQAKFPVANKAKVQMDIRFSYLSAFVGIESIGSRMVHGFVSFADLYSQQVLSLREGGVKLKEEKGVVSGNEVFE